MASSCEQHQAEQDRIDLRQRLEAALPDIRRYVQRRMSRTLRQQESATDLVNSVYGDLLADGVSFEYRGEAQFKAWLRCVVTNKVIGRLRALPARPTAVGAMDELLPHHGTPSQMAILHEGLSLLDCALAALPDRYREVIVRRHLRGESRARIAAALGVTTASVQNLVARAMAKLGRVLERIRRVEA